MSELERIRRDLQEHAADDAVEVVDDPAFDADLTSALIEEPWSDATVEAMSQIVQPVALSQTAAQSALAQVLRELSADARDLDLAGQREHAGVSEQEAASMLGTDAARLRRMEGPAAGRWLQLQPAAVSLYLERIGLSSLRFARWLSARLGGPEQAFGYRPGMTADRHVAVEGEEAADHRDWLAAVLGAPDVDRYADAPTASVFGVDWDAAAIELQRAQIARRARAGLLQRLPSLDPRRAAAAIGVAPRELGDFSVLIRLPTAAGYRYPAFQFDFPRRRIRAVVRYCNERLQPQRDPWGAASWWVSDHDWLGRAPLTLLDEEGGETRLRQAADMIGQYDG